MFYGTLFTKVDVKLIFFFLSQVKYILYVLKEGSKFSFSCISMHSPPPLNLKLL